MFWRCHRSQAFGVMLLWGRILLVYELLASSTILSSFSFFFADRSWWWLLRFPHNANYFWFSAIQRLGKKNINLVPLILINQELLLYFKYGISSVLYSKVKVRVFKNCIGWTSNEAVHCFVLKVRMECKWRRLFQAQAQDQLVEAASPRIVCDRTARSEVKDGAYNGHSSIPSIPMSVVHSALHFSVIERGIAVARDHEYRSCVVPL